MTGARGKKSRVVTVYHPPPVTHSTRRDHVLLPAKRDERGSSSRRTPGCAGSAAMAADDKRAGGGEIKLPLLKEREEKHVDRTDNKMKRRTIADLRPRSFELSLWLENRFSERHVIFFFLQPTEFGGRDHEDSALDDTR